MFAVAKTESPTYRNFLKKYRHYSREFDVRCFPVQSTSQDGKKKGVPSLGENIITPEKDLTYVFNTYAVLAISHGIEDLAADTHEGELVSAFQKMDHFLLQKKRYIELARQLDAVRVWGEGVPPRNCPRIDFIPTFHTGLNRYRLVLFDNAKTHAVLICRQINKASAIDKKLFMGFYSFNPFLVKSIRRSFSLMSCGLDAIIHRWELEHHISPDSIKDIEKFIKEQSPLSKA